MVMVESGSEYILEKAVTVKGKLIVEDLLYLQFMLIPSSALCNLPYPTL